MEFLAELHPKVVHFPIALLITFVLLELIGTLLNKDFYAKTAHLILFLGVIGSIFAVLTGNQAFIAYEYWNPASEALFNNHQTFANLTIWYFTGLLVLRTYLVVKKKYFKTIKYVFLILTLLGGFLVYQTSEYGGELVKKYGIGTELKNNNTEMNDYKNAF